LPSASVPFVIGTSCVHRIPPRVRDDREPPLKVGRDGGEYAGDLGRVQRGNIFTQGASLTESESRGSER
jgi:hypothetical protein